jgi:hypothetical protein
MLEYFKMIKKFYNKIKYSLNVPKVGNTYYGDPLLFVIGKPVEYVLYGLTDKNGNKLVEIVPSWDCYRITIRSIQPLYYILDAEVFCATKDNFKWMSRTQPVRFNKENFKQMVIGGTLTKGNKQ